MSSITVNDKNHPLGECYLIVYPVAAASSRAVSNRHHCLGLAATRMVNNLNLTRETPSGSAGASYASRLEICTVFSAKQIILSGEQDVVATPRTTTVIYAPRAQAETDVDDLKMEICRGKD